MAMKCTVKKNIIKEKRKEENEKSKMAYAQLTQLNVTQQPSHTLPLPPQPMYNITREEALIINICVAHAHYKNIESPGCYAEELNKILKAKQLPTIIIPETPDSRHIYTNTSEQQVKNTTEIPQVKPRKERKGMKEVDGKIKEKGAVGNNENDTEQMEEAITPKDIGLKFYSNKERGWPQSRFNVRDLKEEIQSNKYKFTHENNAFQEEHILQAIEDGQILLKDCWMTVDSDVFRKK